MLLICTILHMQLECPLQYVTDCYRNVSECSLWCVCCQLLPKSEEISAAPECRPNALDETITCLQPEGPFAYDTIYTRAIFAYFPLQLPVSIK